MPFGEHLMIRSKISAVIATMPKGMEHEEKELAELSDRAYELDQSDLVQRIRPVLLEIKSRAGGKGEKVSDFPLAADARRAVYDLETAFIGANFHF